MMMTLTSQLDHIDYVGYRFNPTDYELVSHFLRCRINFGIKFHPHSVNEYPDFFGKEEPWELWERFGGSLEPKKLEPEITMYLFTKRKRQSDKSMRFDRKVGSGTWSGQNPKLIYSDEEESVVIGTKREFRYEGGFDEGHNNAWLMQEYEIFVGDHCCDDVLCTLRKSPRKAPPSPQCVAIGDNKRKKKGQSCVGYDEMRTEEPQSSIVEKSNLEIGQGFHPMLQREMASSGSHYQNDQDCRYTPSELVVDDAFLIPQTQTCCDDENNNDGLSLVVSGGIGQEEGKRSSLEGSIVDQPEMGGMGFEWDDIALPDIDFDIDATLNRWLGQDETPSSSSSDSARSFNRFQ